MSTIPTTFARRTCDGLAQIGPTRFDVVGARFFNDDQGAAGGDAAGADAGAAAGADAGAAAAAGSNGAAAGAQGATDAQTVDQLPEWAQKIVRDARKEAGDHRAAKTAAEQTQQGILAAIAKAAGIEVPGDKPDPEQLAKDLAASRTEGRAYRTQLAVYKAAGAAGANPDALLDSNTFLASVQSLDPTSSDFPTAVAAAIQAAVTANPTLKAARAAGASTVDNPGGTGEQAGQITQEQLDRMTPEQIAEAYEKGLLQNLLT